MNTKYLFLIILIFLGYYSTAQVFRLYVQVDDNEIIPKTKSIDKNDSIAFKSKNIQMNKHCTNVSKQIKNVISGYNKYRGYNLLISGAI